MVAERVWVRAAPLEPTTPPAWRRAFEAVRRWRPPAPKWRDNDLAELSDRLRRDVGAPPRCVDPRDGLFGHAPLWHGAPPPRRPHR
jgi:hypothetical protein